MEKIFIQEGPDGKPTEIVKTNNMYETIALEEWMRKLRDQGYIGPFLLKEMLKKIRRQNNIRILTNRH